MPRIPRALGALLVSVLIAAGLCVGAGSPAQARALPCLVDALEATTSPVIAGSGAVGSPIDLTQMPVWNCAVVETTVQWFNSDGPISGATGTSYTPVVGDAGGVVLAVVTGSVLGLVPVSVPSNAIPVPVPGGGSGDPGDPGDPGTDLLQLVSGLDLPASAEVGQLITLTEPVWSLPGVTTTYQWLRDGVPIPGATGPTYVPGLEDAGHAISAQVTGTLAGIPAVTVITDALNIPLPSGSQLSPTADVVIGGAKKIGTTLTLTGPTWDQEGTTNGYQWLRDDAPIAGATEATYPLVAEDFGHAISVKVTGHKEGFTDNTITSDPVQPVIGDAIQFVTKPRVTGTGKVGKLLTADPGQWTGGTEGSGQPAYSYQWLRDGAAITGAVAQTYQVETADVGKDLAVLVTATRPAYKSGKFTTGPVHVAKLSSKLSASLAKKTVKKGKAATMRLVLKVPGVGSPTGKVKILDGKKSLTKAAFAQGKHGKLVVKLAKLKPGVHKLKAVYAGSATVAGATSKVVKLTVTR
jgi:hypothetical protein